MWRRLTWEQFSRAWKLTLGTAVVIYGTVVLAAQESSAVPYVLVSGLGLLGLTISVPWERAKKNDGEE